MRGKKSAVLGLLCFLFSAVASAEDVSQLKAEIADLKAKVAGIEAARAGEQASGSETLTSMKKNAAITISGEATLDVVVSHRDDGDRNGDNATARRENGDEIDNTSFNTGDAYLGFEIRASRNATLNILLDLDDFNDGAVNEGDLLEECYYLWENVCGKPWTIAFGKKGIDYGMDSSIGISDGFNTGAATWFTAREAADNTANPKNTNYHRQVGTNVFPGAQPTDLYAIETQYSWKGKARFYAAVFQNSTAMHEDRSADTLFFQSYAVKVELTPVERWSFQLSFMNRHEDSARRDTSAPRATVANWDNTENDQQSISAGFTYSGSALTVWGEYQHGFDWQYNDETTADVVGLGLIYAATGSIDLGLMGDWAGIDKAAGYDEERYWQVAVNATRKFDSGIYLTLEYAHLWYDGDATAANSGNVDREADVLAFRTGWAF
jgi:hypothetical protein